MPPTIRFRVPLACSQCGHLDDARSIDLATSGLGTDPIDTSAFVGSALELGLEDFAGGYLTIREPGDDEQRLIALEIWGCSSCHRLQVARIEFRRRTTQIVELVSARTSSFSREALDEANYVSRELRTWAAQPGEIAEQLAALEERL